MVSFTDANTGYVVGRGGTIIKTTNGGGYVGLDEEQKNESTFNIHRNPFTSSTTFIYFLAESSQVKIYVYDNYGLLVGEPVNSFQLKGEQKIEWNAGNLSAGIYFYRIVTDTRQATGRMILIK
jgi:hypothetical protein